MAVGQVPLPDSEALFGQHHNGTAFRRFVGQGTELRRIGQFLFRASVHRQKRHSLAIAQSDGTGFVQQQDVHVAGGLNGAPAHSQHIGLIQTAHAGNADGRKQCADGGRSQTDQQRHQRYDGSGIGHA